MNLSDIRIGFDFMKVWGLPNILFLYDKDCHSLGFLME